jgi:hypothetical protein
MLTVTRVELAPYAEGHYAECRYAECRYAECRGTLLTSLGMTRNVTIW